MDGACDRPWAPSAGRHRHQTACRQNACRHPGVVDIDAPPVSGAIERNSEIRLASAVPAKRSSNDAGRRRELAGGIKAAEACFQNELAAKVDCRHARQRATVRRLTPKCGDGLLRAYLFGAADVLLGRYTRAPNLKIGSVLELYATPASGLRRSQKSESTFP